MEVPIWLTSVMDCWMSILGFASSFCPCRNTQITEVWPMIVLVWTWALRRAGYTCQSCPRLQNVSATAQYQQRYNKVEVDGLAFEIFWSNFQFWSELHKLLLEYAWIVSTESGRICVDADCPGIIFPAKHSEMCRVVLMWLWSEINSLRELVNMQILRGGSAIRAIDANQKRFFWMLLALGCSGVGFGSCFHAHPIPSVSRLCLQLVFCLWKWQATEIYFSFVHDKNECAEFRMLCDCVASETLDSIRPRDWNSEAGETGHTIYISSVRGRDTRDLSRPCD